MRRSTQWTCIAWLALAAATDVCQGEPPRVPDSDFAASAQVNPELGAADDPQLLQDPAYRAAWQERKRRIFQAMYPDVGQALQLSPTEERGLIELLVAQQLERIQQPSLKNWMFKQEQELARYLGPERLEGWHQYQMAAASHQSAERWREEIGGPDELRDDQVDELSRILQQAGAESHLPGPRPEDLPALSDHSPEAMRKRQAYAHHLTEQRDARILELAEPYLSARELAALDAILARHRFWQKPGAQPSSNSSAGARKL